MSSENTPANTPNYWENLNYNLSSADVDIYERYASLLELQKTLKMCKKNIDTESESLVEIVESFSDDNIDELKTRIEKFDASQSSVRNSLARYLTFGGEFVHAIIKHDYKALKNLRAEISDDPKTLELLLLLIDTYSEDFRKKIEEGEEAVVKLISDQQNIM